MYLHSAGHANNLMEKFRFLAFFQPSLSGLPSTWPLGSDKALALFLQLFFFLSPTISAVFSCFQSVSKFLRKGEVRQILGKLAVQTKPSEIYEAWQRYKLNELEA